MMQVNQSSRLELRTAARSQCEERLPGLTGIDFYSGIQILEALQKVRGGDKGAGAVHAHAVEEAWDDESLAPIQADRGHLWTGNHVTRRGSCEIAVDHVAEGDQSVACRAPGITES